MTDSPIEVPGEAWQGRSCFSRQIVTVIIPMATVVDNLGFQPRRSRRVHVERAYACAQPAPGSQAGRCAATKQAPANLTLIEDTSGGIHDTLIAACDPLPAMPFSGWRTTRQLHG